MTRRSIRRAGAGALGIAAAAAVALAAISTSEAAGSRALHGTFQLAPGKFAKGRASGTYFRMLYPNKKQYFPNPDSKASDKTFILGVAGRDGGLRTGTFQSFPGPAFDSKGNARANGILRPGSFTGIRFSVATVRKDPQSGKAVAATSARVSGRRLTVRIPGFTVAWNNQFFNQGAPKPDGSGAEARGTYDPDTKRFAFEWRSTVKGGAFDRFVGSWHFEGTFKPR